MKYIKDLNDGDRVADIYMCKQRTAAVTKNGKNYLSLILQDKTGVIDAKVWDPSSPGIAEFDAMDYVEVMGDVSMLGDYTKMLSQMEEMDKKFEEWDSKDMTTAET